MDLALGLAPHSGWAIAVVVGGTAEQPVVLHRERVLLCPDHLPRQAYHAAQGLPSAEGARLVTEVDAAVAVTTAATLTHLLRTAADHGRAVGMGLLGNPRPLPALEQALANHTMLHSAEGELYRGALDDAAAAVGLPVIPLPPKDVLQEAAAQLGTTTSLLEARVAALRSELGAPWAADHRRATAAALVAVHAA